MAVPTLWRTKEQRYRLQGDLCPSCNQTVFPPKPVCPHCRHGAVVMHNDHDDYHYTMVFPIPQTEALNLTGDD